jgi:phage terminase small subunit
VGERKLVAAKRHPRTKKLNAGLVAAHERRVLFAKEYLIEPNGTQAAIKAGYSPKTAYSKANQLLKHVEVRAILDASHAKAAAKLDVTRETILAELAKIGFSNPMDYGSIKDGHFDFDLSTSTRDHMAAVQELKTSTKTIGTGKSAVLERHTTLKLSNKREALVDLGRAIGLFKDDGGDGTPVTFIIQNLHVDGAKAHGRAQAERGAGDRGEEFVDPARTTAHLR